VPVNYMNRSNPFQSQWNPSLFVDFFIRRPVFATVCALFIILAGAISIPTLPIAEFPDLAPPQVIVSSGYIGANAQTVESRLRFRWSRPSTASRA